MPAYGTIRKQIAKITGEIPELAELDHYVNDLKASVQPTTTEVVRTVKVPDDSILQEVRTLRQAKVELEESLDQERRESGKAYKEVHYNYLNYLRSLQFGLIVAETVLPNYVRTFLSEPESRDFILKPGARLILVDRQGEQQAEGFCCQTYLCETIPDLMKQIKDCPDYILIFACGGGVVTQYCVTTTSGCAAELTSLVEAAAEIMLRKIRTR